MYKNEVWSPYSILNGRVNATDLVENKLNIKKYIYKDKENFNNITSREYTPTCVSDLFFSRKNIDALQQGIRYKVFVLSNEKYIINNQSETELKIIMRANYLQFSKNLTTNVVEQVRELNKLVIDWSINQIMTNIKQNEAYKIDISTLPMPLERSQLPSQKGTRTLEIKSFI